MSEALPKSAKELIALIEQHLSTLSVEEQARFWLLISDHKNNEPYQRVTNQLVEMMRRIGDAFHDTLSGVTAEANRLHEQAKKQRRPTVNAERDAEIMKLHEQGLTAGKIVTEMKKMKDWGKLNDRIVNSVIHRERRKLREEQDR